MWTTEYEPSVIAELLEAYADDILSGAVVATDIPEAKRRLGYALEDAAYEIRLALGDQGALSAYWDDERFADRKARDKK